MYCSSTHTHTTRRHRAAPCGIGIKENVWEIWHWLASAFLTDNGTLCDPTQCLCGCHGSHRGWKDIGLLQHNRRWVCHQRWPRLPTPCSRRWKQTLTYTYIQQWCSIVLYKILAHGTGYLRCYLTLGFHWCCHTSPWQPTHSLMTCYCTSNTTGNITIETWYIPEWLGKSFIVVIFVTPADMKNDLDVTDEGFRRKPKCLNHFSCQLTSRRFQPLR